MGIGKNQYGQTYNFRSGTYSRPLFLLSFLSAPRSEKREVAAENPPPPQSRWRRRPYLGNRSADINKNWTHHCGRITPCPPAPSAPLPLHRHMAVGADWWGGASSIYRFKFRRNRPGGCRDMGDRGWGRGDDNDNNKWIRSCGGIMFLSMYHILHTVFFSDNKMTRMWKFTWGFYS